MRGGGESLQIGSYVLSSFIDALRKKIKGDYATRYLYAILKVFSASIHVAFPFLLFAALPAVYIKEWYCFLNLSFTGLSTEECIIEPYPF